jgi:radical SAM protein with 4Fe4S-binding SPASM domain
MNLKSKIQSKLHNKYKEIETNEHKLSYLFLEITKKCNLNCLHCGSDCKSSINSPELTTDSWLKIIDYFHETYSNSVAFIITGGEPLLHNDLEIIGNKISNLKMHWGMVTNGLALTEQKLNSLIKSGIYSITLSLDGLKNSHNKLRNNQYSFEKTLQALENVSKSEIKFKDVVTCVYPDNLSQLDEIAEILISKKIPAWRLFRIFPSGRAADNQNILLSFEQTLQMVNWIKVNKMKYLDKGLNINLSCEGWLPFDEDKKVRDNPFFCRAGINIASILSDGTITGCSNNHPTFYEGNILKDNFNFLWQNKFEKFRKKEWLENTICIECEHIKNCNGNSVHLWNLENKKSNFCYVKDLK